jgi:hypothetical protein
LFRTTQQQEKKAQAKSTIRDYILLLYAFMEKEGTCFLRGSFVIDDINGRFKELLALAKTNPKFKIPESHTGFNPVRTTICKDGVCEVHTKVTTRCGDDGLEKENIKWYVFNNTAKAGDPVDRYVFLKLEGEATISFGHALSALRRYGLKKQAKTGVSTQIRRQDCAKDPKGCHCPKQGCKQDRQTVKIGQSCMKKTQQYGRLGDEYFVPSQLNDAIIDRITTIKGPVDTMLEDLGPCQQQKGRQQQLSKPQQQKGRQPQEGRPQQQGRPQKQGQARPQGQRQQGRQPSV